MKTLHSTSHSTWSSLSQFFNYRGILLLFSLTIVLCGGNPCPHNSKTVTLEVGADETTYVDSVGRPLEVFCSVPSYKPKLTSRNLIFTKSLGGKVDDKLMSIVNETTIRLRFENKETSNDKYYCYLINPEESNEIHTGSSNHTKSNENEDLINSSNYSNNQELLCWNTIVIGNVPNKVENISCTVKNQELRCRWDVLQKEYGTNYTIQYEPVPSKGGALACPNDEDVYYNNTCTWSLTTIPQKLKVTVTGANRFGKTVETSIINQFLMLPVQPPSNLKFLNKTSTSIELEWSIGERQSSPVPWIYRMHFRTLKSNWSEWIVLDSTKVTKNGGKISYNVTNLTPYTLYDFQVCMKPQNANDYYWSETVGKVFRTKSPEASI